MVKLWLEKALDHSLARRIRRHPRPRRKKSPPVGDNHDGRLQKSFSNYRTLVIFIQRAVTVKKLAMTLRLSTTMTGYRCDVRTIWKTFETCCRKSNSSFDRHKWANRALAPMILYIYALSTTALCRASIALMHHGCLSKESPWNRVRSYSFWLPRTFCDVHDVSNYSFFRRKS